jgi:plastocyanin
VRKLPIALAAATLTSGLAPAATADDAPVRAAKTRVVKVGDSFYGPKRITVRRGTIVKWVWGTDGATETAVEHDVYSTKGTRLRSGFKLQGTYRKRIRKTTRYLCRVHATSMRGTIVVKR